MRDLAAPVPRHIYELNRIKIKSKRLRGGAALHPLLTVCSLPGPTDTMVIFTPRSSSILST